MTGSGQTPSELGKCGKFGERGIVGVVNNETKMVEMT